MLRAALVIALTAGVAMAGPDWQETEDAGARGGSAQAPRRPAGVESLNTISGTLAGETLNPDFVDMYWIRIADIESFRVDISATEGFDPALYLFRADEIGLLANDDVSEGNLSSFLRAVSNDGSGAAVTEEGDYLLAITTSGWKPFSDNGFIFNIAGPGEISGPDGPQGAGFLPLLGWRGLGAPGTYRMDLRGVDFPTVPAPGAAMMLALGGLAALRRRR